MYPTDTLPFLHALYTSVQGFVTLTTMRPDGKRLVLCALSPRSG